MLIYLIFYIIDTTNFSFSETILNKAKEVTSKDYDFYGAYNSVIDTINTYLYSEQEEITNKVEGGETVENQVQETSKVEENRVDGIYIAELPKEEEEGVNQSEIKHTEESETDRIKKEYDFVLPLSRNNLFRIWRKRSYSKCNNSLS